MSRKTYWSLAVAVPLFLICVGRCAAVQYVAEGTLTFLTFGPQKEVVSELRRDFEVRVDSCQWSISTTNRSPEGLVLTRWVTASTNSGEVFRVTYYPQNPKGHIMAVIESNTVPSACDDDVSQYLWLMLASGCYLDQVTDGQLPPVYDPLLNAVFDKNLKYKAFVDRLSSTPQLPRNIVYLNDGFFRTRDSKNANTILHKVGWPFDKGFTNAVFSILGVTNIEQCAIPTGFQFIEFGPSVGPDGNPVLSEKRRMEAIVARVRPTTTPSEFLPQLSQRTVVQDRRLDHSGSEPATYSIQDGNWITVDQLRAKEKSAASRESNLKIRVRLLVAVLLLSIIPIIFAVTQRASGESGKRKN